jgi:hypothetical protein
MNISLNEVLRRNADNPDVPLSQLYLEMSPDSLEVGGVNGLFVVVTQ